MAPPLIVTADDSLLEELLRLAAAAGVTPEVAPDAGIGLQSWPTAPLVLLGLDQAAAMVRLGPVRRTGVVVVSWHGIGPEGLRLALRLGAGEVVELPQGEGWVVEQLTDLDDATLPSGVVLGVAGGSGGAGASTFACALAQVAARSGPALLVDADPLGAGLDRMLGLEGEPGVRWAGLDLAAGRLSARSLREAVPRRDGLGVLSRGPGDDLRTSPSALQEVVSAARRGHRVVVVDLPRTDRSVVQELVVRCDVLVVVARSTVLGLTAAARLCDRHPTASCRVVVRGRGVLEHEVAALTGATTVVAMADQRRLDERLDLGLGPWPGPRGPLHRAAVEVLASVAAPTPVQAPEPVR